MPSASPDHAAITPKLLATDFYTPYTYGIMGCLMEPFLESPSWLTAAVRHY
jgi:hypothetical protein